jgi:hypothetical protein
MTEDLVERTTRELRQRIAELEAATEELPKLKAALAALGEGERAVAGRQRTTRRPSARSRRQRRPRGANRAAILSVIEATPGLTVGEVASAVADQGVGKAVTYSTVSQLVKQGRLSKHEGRLEVRGS